MLPTGSGLWTPEAVLTGLGLVLVIITWGLDRYWIRRSRVTYRVHLDTGVDVTPEGADLFELRVLRGDARDEVTDASIVLIRIRNQGSADVPRGALEGPLTFTFPGRTVLSAVVPETEPHSLKTVLDEEGLAHDGPTLRLPRVSLNRGNRIKLLVLLQGAGQGVRAEAFIAGGEFVADSGRIAPSRRSLVLGAAALLLAGTFAGVLVRSIGNDDGLCGSGELQVVGSTAFEPVMREAVSRYRLECPGARISIDALGSRAGLDKLSDDGGALSALLDARLAMSDVRSPRPELHGRAVGTLVYAVVVNRATGVTDLSRAQLTALYAGRYRSWAELGGDDVPVVLVSRDAGSGTRAVFEEQVLGGQEAAPSVREDCREALAGQPVVRCELGTTEDVLRTVERLPGAIGYAQPSDLAEFPGARTVSIDGITAEGAVRDRRADREVYPFLSQEYLYTYGIPRAGGLLSDFLEYLTSVYLPTDEARETLLEHGFVPLNRTT